MLRPDGNKKMKGFDKLKNTTKKAVGKMPKPVRDKADKKLGLFMHKYVATLYYFDDEIQEIYWDMEDQADKGYYYQAPEGEKSVSELSNEMRMVIQLKNDKDSGYHDRKHEKMSKKISKKMSEQAEKIEDISMKNPRKLVDLASEVLGKDEVKEEDIKETFDMEEVLEEEKDE